MPNIVRMKIFKDPAAAPTHDLGDLPWYPGLTALQAMIIGEAMYNAANFEFQVKYRSILGAYVFSIDALSDGDQPDHYWFLYIDGASSKVGASEALIFEDQQKTSVLVEWKYEHFSAVDTDVMRGRSADIPTPAA